MEELENTAPSLSSSTPANSLVWKERNRATATLIRSLSETSQPTHTSMNAEYVVLETKSEQTGKLIRRSVYVTEQNGTRTLDLYSGWHPESQKHKVPLKDLPEKVCRLFTLERLWVSHNRLSSLPAKLNQLTRLREVFLHRNNFEEIPACLCKLPSLQLLWLNNNKITSIPAEISQLTSLKRLHLDHNFIKDLPDSLCTLSDLEVLYLNNNTIHRISDEIGSLNKLKRLYLSHNKITDLPSGITKLTDITLLLLEHNEIRSVRREFSTYQANLEAQGKVISLKNNPFFTPQSKLKLSLAGIGSSPKMPLRVRRLSDQPDRDKTAKRPTRVSLPAKAEIGHEFKRASTLPRSSRLSSKEEDAPPRNAHRSGAGELDPIPIICEPGQPHPSQQNHAILGENAINGVTEIKIL